VKQTTSNHNILALTHQNCCNYMPRHILWLPKITLSEITLANRNQLGQNFTQRHWFTWHAPLETFGTLRQTGTKWQWKTVFSEPFVIKTMYHFTHFQAADFPEISDMSEIKNVG